MTTSLQAFQQIFVNPFQHIDKVVKQKDLQQQLVDAKLHQAQELLKDSEDRHDREKEFVMSTSVQRKPSVWSWTLTFYPFLLWSSCWKKRWSLKGCVNWWSSRKFTSNSRFLLVFGAQLSFRVIRLAEQGGVFAFIAVVAVHGEVWRVSDDIVQEQRGVHHL